MIKKNEILSLLPYTDPFLFVDEILEVSENNIEGSYHFKSTHSFYKGHFKDYPVTPGVILAECMAQIGVASLGIYLLGSGNELKQIPRIALTSTNVEFLRPVYPDDQVFVKSNKKYFRFNKLKCLVTMEDKDGNMLCKGEIAGMILKPEQ